MKICNTCGHIITAKVACDNPGCLMASVATAKFVESGICPKCKKGKLIEKSEEKK